VNRKACRGSGIGDTICDARNASSTILKKAEAEFKDVGMDYWLRRTQEVLARVEG
jgi:hypothetical protein